MPSRDDPAASTTDSESAFNTVVEKLGQTSFDPVQYLNEVLPTLNLNLQNANTPKQSRSGQLQTASADVQSQLSQLNAVNIRSSSEFTALTDEILRSGNKLAYEVEVLRGDANSLHETLTETLKDDILQFLKEAPDAESNAPERKGDSIPPQPSIDPEFIQQLRTLGLVKSRLESVVNVFGEALKWPIPPSEVSGSNLISVSAPELGVANSEEDDKAREYTRQLRSEISELLDSDGGGYAGLKAASTRVDEFRNLTILWKGTSEERPRIRVVDGFAKLVEDRRKALDARAAQARANLGTSSSRSSSTTGRASKLGEGATNTASGLFRGLQKLRDEIYLD